MVHTHFVWPHGGNQVFLCGDFTAWIKFQQMVTVEGSSTTFMTICDLPPGLHKFKFWVDGMWRIDERLPMVEDENGVNNVVVVEQSQMYSLNDGLPVMHIDGYDYRNHANVASTSGSVPNELEGGLTADELETTTRRLFKHFSSHKAYDLIPDSGKVFALDDNISVEDAFLVMHEEGLAVAPLWNAATLQISGMLTASDFIMILMELQRNRAMATNNVNQFSTISAWKEGKLQLQRRPLIQIHPDDPLNNVAVRILENRISSTPVLYVPEGFACPQLLHVACLSGLLEHIRRHFEHCTAHLPLLQRAIGVLPIGTWIREIGGARELKTFPPNCLLSDAFRLLMDEHISSVPIVDDKGTFINVFCRSDVLSLAKNNAYVHAQLDQTTISQALQLVDANAPGRYMICTRSDSLYRVISLLSDPGGPGSLLKKEAPVNFLTDPLEGKSTLRPAYVLVFGWIRAKHACVDLTGVSPLVGLGSGVFTVGQAALKAASGKVAKHEKACIDNQHVFIPFAFDTFGFIAPEAVELLSRVQRVMHSNVSTPGSINVVFKRLGFAIQKGLAAQLVARLPSLSM